jgi:hypothetical protein
MADLDSLDIVSQLRDRRYPGQHEMREMAACVIEQLRRETLRLRPLENEQIESLLLQGFPQWGFDEQTINFMTYEQVKDGIGITRVKPNVLNLAHHLLARGARSVSEQAISRAEAALYDILLEVQSVHFSRSRVQQIGQLGLGNEPDAPVVVGNTPEQRVARADVAIAKQLKESIERNSRLCAQIGQMRLVRTELIEECAKIAETPQPEVSADVCAKNIASMIRNLK